ncbi:MAG: DUF4268 domain-containing protein [Rhodospirillales bacterium]|nr:DUF4268 domain-containing protein [Rhodospirillales bacterium]
MSAVIPLGTFEPVSVKDAWPNEAGNFTPWLAEAGSIAALGEALGLDLEVEATEAWIGSFSADILARASDEPNHRVLIENQFGETDHRHLGQMLTYPAGIDGARTVVWIAEKILPDHRAAVDWLNTNTKPEFSFFAVEIELWRIGNSAPAPRFNVVASPNEWTRGPIVVPPGNGELAGRYRIRLAYWASFADYLGQKGSKFRIGCDNKDPWFWFATGRAGFGIVATIGLRRQRIGVNFNMSDDADKSKFHALYSEKESIEQQFGEPLLWEELPGKKASRIAVYRDGVDPADPSQYDDLHKWMLDKMERFRTTFSERVKLLGSSGDTEPGEEETPDGV